MNTNFVSCSDENFPACNPHLLSVAVAMESGRARVVSQTLQCSTTDHTYTRAFCHNPQPCPLVRGPISTNNHLKSNRSPVKKLHHRKIVHRNVGVNVQLANTDKHCIETTLCKHFEMVVWMLHNKYYSVQTKVMEVLRRWIGRS